MGRLLTTACFSLLIVFFTGCATTTSIIQKRSYDQRTTGLFIKPCKEKEDIQKDKKRKGFEAKVKAATLGTPREREKQLEGTVNDCNATDIPAMVERFMSIAETDEIKGMTGDTNAEVRKKGFTIYADEKERHWRKNIRLLYGNDALAAVGMGVTPPPLQKPEEIEMYTRFMSGFYGEEYFEKDYMHEIDRICINTRNTLEIGEDRIFTIVWRNGKVFKRVIKGGSVNNPKKETALLLCPSGFLGDLVTGGVQKLAK